MWAVRWIWYLTQTLYEILSFLPAGSDIVTQFNETAWNCHVFLIALAASSSLCD